MMKRIIGIALVIVLVASLSFVNTYANNIAEDDFTTEQIFGVMDDDFMGSFTLYSVNTVERDYDSAYYYPMCGMKVTMDDKLLVSDTQYGRIHVYDMSLGHDKTFGSLGYGDGKLQYPVDIAEDSEGNLFIADFFGMNISKFSSSGEFLGSFGTEGEENGQFIGPGGVAVDNDGNIYVSDSTTARVQKFDSSFNYVDTFNMGDGESAPLSSPGIIRVAADGNIYVAEMTKGQIYIFDNKGKYIRPALKLGDESINRIGAFEFDSKGKIYVLDRAPATNIVRIFKPNGVLETSHSNIMDPDAFADGFALANDGSLFLHSNGSPPPTGGTVDPENPFFCPNHMSLKKVSSDGSVVETIDFDPNEYGRAGDMTDCAVKSNGKIYGLSTHIVDEHRNVVSKIFVWDPDGDLIDVLDPSNFELDSSVMLTSIAVDSFDNLFVGVEKDGKGKVVKLNEETDSMTVIGENILGEPSSIAVDKMDNIYVADITRNSIVVFTNLGRFRNEIRINMQPNAVDVDQFRNILVVSNNQVVVLNKKGREVAAFGGTGRNKGSIYFARGAAFTGSGDIIVGDTENGRLQIFKKTEGATYEVDSVSNRMFPITGGLTWGPDNKLYVTDGFHGVVHKVAIKGQFPQGGGDGEGSEPPIPPEPPENETILSDGEILFTPSSTTIQAGSIGEINIDIDFASNVFGVGMTLKYDPIFLKLEDCKPGDFLSADGNSNLFHFVETIPGTVMIAGPTRTGAVGGSNGSGTLIELKFSGVGKGETVIELEEVIIKDPQLNNIQVVTKTCGVNVMAMDSQPPEINLNLPSCSWTSSFTLNGKTERGASLELDVGGKKSNIPVKPDGSFSYAMTLKTGSNKFKLVAKDTAGNKIEKEYNINLNSRNVIIMWVGKSNYITNGKPGTFDVPPQILGASTFVPLRALGDMLSCKTEWFGAEKKVLYTYTDVCSGNKTVLEIWIGKQIGKMNGKNWDMGKAPQIVNSRTLVPLRAISEGLGAGVGWEGATKQITITHPKQ